MSSGDLQAQKDGSFSEEHTPKKNRKHLKECWRCKKNLTLNRFSIPETDVCDKCHLDGVRFEYQLEKESNEPGGWRHEERMREIREMEEEEERAENLRDHGFKSDFPGPWPNEHKDGLD